jgi:hypothetical protein
VVVHSIREWSSMQSREDLNSAGFVQQLVSEANVLSRDYYANRKTCIRVRTSKAQSSGAFKHLICTSTIIPLEIWDCPGNITVDTLGAPLSQFATMIFVIDIRVRRHCRVFLWLTTTNKGPVSSTYREAFGFHCCCLSGEPEYES